ncbi:MAG: PA2169 family four-helix-bundle protein [Phycisphaeraceae bacterium]
MDQQTIDKLKDLTRINRDSAAGFEEAADVVENDRLQQLFRDLAKQRVTFADELNRYVDLNEGDTEITTSWRNMFHRWWIDVRGKAAGGDAYVVLAEAERGEDAIKHMYEDVLKQTAGSPVNETLLKQYGEVKKGHDTVRDLRDAVKDN